jgi:hypothetical protein
MTMAEQKLTYDERVLLGALNVRKYMSYPKTDTLMDLLIVRGLAEIHLPSPLNPDRLWFKITPAGRAALAQTTGDDAPRPNIFEDVHFAALPPVELNGDAQEVAMQNAKRFANFLTRIGETPVTTAPVEPSREELIAALEDAMDILKPFTVLSEYQERTLARIDALLARCQEAK